MWYRRKLDDEISAMQKSVIWWLSSAYRGTGLGQDASPTNDLLRALRKLTKRWQTRFDRLANKLGKEFASSTQTYTDKTLNARLHGHGFSVPFTYTSAMKDAYQAVAAEQVNLIKSIPAQCMTEVQGMVLRSVQRGRDLGTLSQDLQDRFHITRSRAALIARDQNNKATSVMGAARQQSLGIDEGIWKHSHAGKVPRPDHVEADGKKFSLSKGMFIDGEWIMPGEKINCRCTWQPVIPGFIN